MIKKLAFSEKLLILFAFVLVTIVILQNNSCNTDKLIVKETIFDTKKYDEKVSEYESKIDSLNAEVLKYRETRIKVITKYKVLNDTIIATPIMDQFNITQKLCPSTGDSVNLQEINLCLSSGNEAIENIELYKIENTTLDEIIIAKDTIISAVVSENKELGNALIQKGDEIKSIAKIAKKQTRLKAIYKTTTIIFGAIAIALIALM